MHVKTLYRAKQKNINYMKKKLQPLSKLRGENIKGYKIMKALFGINSIENGGLLL